jgi:alkylation response protein AidB-like acyl-CoA dehydrogenase
MNFDFTDDQRSIKSTAKEFLAARYKADKLRELAEAGEYDPAIWDEMRELGWAGIFVDEEYEGQGLGTVELTILMEELGYALAPSPFLSNAAAGLVIQHAGSDEQKRRWLPGIASGEQPGALGQLKNGRAPLVPDAEDASVIVLFDGETGQVRLVERSAAEVERVDTIDSTRKFASVTADRGEAVEGDVEGGLCRVATAIAAELTGVAQRTMEMAVDYAKERKQFERPIGAYQAVSHRCAQMLMEVESARALTYFAAYAADHEPEELPLAASSAKAYASDAGWRVSASSLQVHGGIGFTWEHDLHFFLKRAKTDGHLFGTARQHRDRVADLSMARAGAPA